MKRYLLIVVLCLFGFTYGTSLAQSETIRFKSEDGLEMAADLYFNHPKTAPFIVLFHQANWSRGEYAEIAPRLNSMGYNCMAVDLRSGNSVNDVSNITKQNALKAMKETQYVDAIPDMLAAVDYAIKNYAQGKLIAWGSSYSASLALKLCGDYKDKIDAVLAFSPGEYFTSQGKARDYITSSATNITQPAFIASARDEKNNWWGIYVAIPSGKKTYFLPQSVGNHGAKALWSKYPDADSYWKAVSDFLTSI